MNTIDLINKVAQENALTLGRSEMILSIIFERIAQGIKEGNPVTIPGFGTFNIVLKETAPSYGYQNENTSSQKYYVSFSPDSNFDNIINS